MSIERFFKQPLLYKNKKYVGLYGECYPIKMVNHKFVDCIFVRGEEPNKPSKIIFEALTLDALTKFLHPQRVEGQMVIEYHSHDEYRYGSVFVVEREARFMYISIGDNFAIRLPNDLNGLMGMRILNISRDISNDRKMYMVNINAAAKVLEYRLKQIKEKDSILDKIQNQLSSADIFQCCSELIESYMSSIDLDMENYYIRRNIERLLEYCLMHRQK